jgi:nucleoside-diphosphate-sugar epimerase
MGKLSIFGGTGFIGSKFNSLYPDAGVVIPRDSNIPLTDDVLFLISTTNNYNVFKDVHLDINTNLNKLMDVLPNVKGTFNFISSWFVYGGGYNNRSSTANELSACNPTGFYSITKKAAEELVASYCNTFHFKYRILRLCNVIGGDPTADSKKNALEFMIQKVMRGEDVNVYRGSNYRNFLPVEDVCAAIKLVTETGDTNAIYNIGGERSFRIIDIIEYAKTKLNSRSKIHIVDAPEFHTIVQAKDFFMDCYKLNRLGFVRKYTLSKLVDGIILKLQSKN